jgi:hypothetical protein
LNVVYPPQILGFSPQTNGIYWLQTNFEMLSTVVTNPFYGYSSPLNYQWYSDGAAIPSASGATGNNMVTVTYAPSAEETNMVVVTN